MYRGCRRRSRCEAEQARFRLFDSVAGFLRNASDRQPVVLMLDDLQRADESSLALLRFLVQELRGSRLLLIGAYREESAATALVDLVGDPACSKILMRGLSEREVARFVELLAGGKAPAGLVSAVHEQTAGQPFYVGELVRVFVADGGLDRAGDPDTWRLTIPRGVRELVARRLDICRWTPTTWSRWHR